MKYVINFSSIKEMSLNDVNELLISTAGKRLCDMKIKDLSFENNIPIFPGNGVYLFKENSKIIYIGKCSSTSFTERLSKHFDFRTNAWMNGLVKNICSKQWKKKVTDDNLKLASKHAFEKLSIILISFTTDFDKINRLEKVLQRSLDALNSPKSKRINDKEKKLNIYLQ